MGRHATVIVRVSWVRMSWARMPWACMLSYELDARLHTTSETMVKMRLRRKIISSQSSSPHTGNTAWAEPREISIVRTRVTPTPRRSPT